MVTEFRNEPVLDFSKPEVREKMTAALAKLRSEFGKNYDLVINGKRVATENRFASINPSNTDEVIGHVAKADRALAEEAMQSALNAFESWKRVAPKERARVLFKTAALLRKRRYDFDALLSYEAGKNWLEADADLAETIDLIEFYGREMIRLSEEQPLTRIGGEDNELTYIPLGVGIIVPPWNFPMAIMAGMTTAAIVSGNTAILKPATPTPILAAKFVELMEDAGLPAGVLNYLPGSGSEIGDYLVDHPKTRFVSFTGSKEVGIRINERAAIVHPGQKWLKRVVLEMGGKDAIIVDKGIDVKEAVPVIAMSAFSFSGQKCSICSRVVVHQDIYDEFVTELVRFTNELKVGPSYENVDLGPVIDHNAYQNILSYIEVGKGEAELLCGGEKAEGNGYFIKPTIFGNVDRNARIHQEEIFGPVLVVTKAKDFDDALDIANGTEYGLTGGVYSNDRFNLMKAREDFHVGNLYFNRKITGALVGAQPFGGFNMSGTDSKAGGRDYLLLFTQIKVVVEKF